MNVIDSSEPLVPDNEDNLDEPVPHHQFYCVINYETGESDIRNLFDWELKQCIAEGYTVVTYSALHDYRIDQVTKADKRRRKTELQKLRRQLGAAYIKPPRDKR